MTARQAISALDALTGVEAFDQLGNKNYSVKGVIIARVFVDRAVAQLRLPKSLAATVYERNKSCANIASTIGEFSWINLQLETFPQEEFAGLVGIAMAATAMEK